MKNFKLFCGFDISKKTIDAALKESHKEIIPHEKFFNNLSGYKKLLTWIHKHSDCSNSEILFCLEHTGVYVLPLIKFLSENNLNYCLENPLKIKRSMGITRIKNDKADAKLIARYAYEKCDQLRLYKFPGNTLIKLQALLAHRNRLMKAKHTFAISGKELADYTEKEIHSYISKESKSMVKMFDNKLAKIEVEIDNLIQSSEQIKKNYNLATSVKGIGKLIAAYMIVYTHNFTTFSEGRKFACYSGIAPFEYSSGTSIKGKNKISHLANKKMKALLSNGACSAMNFDRELKKYSERKLDEGKEIKCVINNLRNKLVSRVFAVVKRGTPYVEMYRYAA